MATHYSDKFPYHRSVMLSDPRPWLHQQPQPQERGQSLCRVGQRPIRVRLSIPTSYSFASRLAVALIRYATTSMKAWGSTLDPHGKSGASHLDIFNPSDQCAAFSLLSTKYPAFKLILTPVFQSLLLLLHNLKSCLPIPQPFLHIALVPFVHLQKTPVLSPHT